MTWRDIKQCVIKIPSITKEGENMSKSSAMFGQTMGEMIAKNCWGSLKTSSQACLGNTTRILEIVSQETLCKRS
jgi:hypothetical protein